MELLGQRLEAFYRLLIYIVNFFFPAKGCALDFSALRVVHGTLTALGIKKYEILAVWILCGSQKMARMIVSKVRREGPLGVGSSLSQDS